MIFKYFENVIWIFFLVYACVFQVFGENMYLQSLNLIILFLFYFFNTLIMGKTQTVMATRGFVGFCSLVFISIISSLLSENVLHSLAMVVLYIIFIFSIREANMRGIKVWLPEILKGYSFVTLSFIVLMIALNDFDLTTRFAYIRSPNSMALILLSLLPGFGFTNPKFRPFLYATVATIALILQSRNGIIGVAIYFLIAQLVLSQSMRFGKLAYTFSLIVGVSLILTFWSSISDLLLLGDDYRGSDTNFSGRVFAWLHSLKIIQENVVFGVGIGNSHLYFHHVTGTAGASGYNYLLTGTHNGYLKVFVDFGVPAALMIFWFTVRGLSGIINQKSTWSAPLVGFSAAYLFFCIFEESLFGLGNPSSLIFLMITLVGLSRSFSEIEGLKV